LLSPTPSTHTPFHAQRVEHRARNGRYYCEFVVESTAAEFSLAVAA